MAKTKKPPEPEKPTIRDALVKTYFTPQDAEFLAEFAKGLGMSRSSLIVAIMERLILSGFSMRGADQLMAQIQKRAKDKGADRFQGLYFGVRPLPALPEEDSAATGHD
jgi:hypothetical protein